MYEVLVDQLLKQTARKLIVESGNKAYIIEQPIILTNSYQSISQPGQVAEPQVFSDTKLVTFIQKKWGVKPAKNQYVVTLIKDGEKYTQESDYNVGQVIGVIISGELIGYLVYCNDQEVIKYAKQ